MSPSPWSTEHGLSRRISETSTGRDARARLARQTLRRGAMFEQGACRASCSVSLDARNVGGLMWCPCLRHRGRSPAHQARLKIRQQLMPARDVLCEGFTSGGQHKAAVFLYFNNPRHRAAGSYSSRSLARFRGCARYSRPGHSPCVDQFQDAFEVILDRGGGRASGGLGRHSAQGDTRHCHRRSSFKAQRDSISSET